jgi:hypothetical protein
MLIAKLPAAIVAVLLMSPVSAKAMEFADRPGPVSETFASALAVRAMQSEERSQRQINNRNILHPVSIEWIKLADRPRPISNLKRVWVVQTKLQNRPGRLSAEFSAVAKSSRMKFEYGPGEVSSWFNRSEIWHRNGSARLCVGSMAPCDSLNFAEMGSLSRAYTERL